MLPIVLLLAIWALPASAAPHQVTRNDHWVNGDPGIRLFVREVVASGSQTRPPILLIHGARVPGIASFDLPAAGGSLAADLANLGYAVYVMDVRGYGASTRPREMNEPPGAHPPLVRSSEAVRDIAAVVDWVRKRSGTPRLALFGWATGGSWAGYYAALYSDHISALILDNTLYGGSSEHKLLGHGTDFEDPRHPGRFNAGACGAYRLNTAQSLLGAWDRGIPVSDKNVWRDPAVAKSYVDAAIASDPTSNSRTPPSFRSPFGALEDSFYQAIGRQLWDASLIRVPTLVISGEFDFWSRAADREALQQDLVHAPMVRVVVVPGATHFMHLDRAEHGRRRFLQEVQSFLDDSAGASGGRRR